MYSLLLKNEPTSIYSYLTRNKKWKSWVGWHGSSCWLLCLCVLCFVFYAASKTFQCSWVSPYFICWKMKIMSYAFWRVFLSIKLRPEKITTGKKRRYSRLAVGWNKSQITVCHAKIRTPTITGKIMTRKIRYSHLAVGWNKSQITVCRVKIRTPTTTVKKYVREKKVQSFATHVTFYFYYVCT
jgi:hypothetical protein